MRRRSCKQLMRSAKKVALWKPHRLTRQKGKLRGARSFRGTFDKDLPA